MLLEVRGWQVLHRKAQRFSPSGLVQSPSVPFLASRGLLAVHVTRQVGRSLAGTASD